MSIEPGHMVTCETDEPFGIVTSIEIADDGSKIATVLPLHRKDLRERITIYRVAIE